MKRLYDLGAPDNAICRILECTWSWVKEWRLKNGLLPHAQFYRRKDVRANPAVKWEDTMPIRLVEGREE